MDYINDKTLIESTNSKELTMNNDKENYINSEEAAKYLRDRGLCNITRASLSQLRHIKKGPDYFKMKGSRQIYYLISELEKWIAAVMVPVSPPKEQSSSVATVQQAQTENHSSRATADTTQSPSEISIRPSWNGSSTTGSSVLPPTDEPESE